MKSLPGVLLVDDEKLTLKNFKEIFYDTFPVYTSSNANDGLEILKRNGNIGVVVADQRMPGVQGLEFLSQVQKQFPNILRILATAYPGDGIASKAIRECKIYHFIKKPWDLSKLEEVICSGLEIASFQEANRLPNELEGGSDSAQLVSDEEANDRVINFEIHRPSIQEETEDFNEYLKIPSHLSPLELAEKFVIQKYLKKHNGNKTATKNSLKISINTLNAKMKKYDLI